jgi:hypothetical protein
MLCLHWTDGIHLAYLTCCRAVVHKSCGALNCFTFLNHLHLHALVQVVPSCDKTCQDVKVYLLNFFATHYTLLRSYHTSAVTEQVDVLVRHARWDAFYLEMFNRYCPTQYTLKHNLRLDSSFEAESNQGSGGNSYNCPDTSNDGTSGSSL